MDMIPPGEIISLSDRAFWDTNKQSLDFETQGNTIIVRVFERGSTEDIAEVLAFYGKERIKRALTETPYLTEKTLIFVSKLFDVPISEFKCSTTKQLHPIS